MQQDERNFLAGCFYENSEIDRAVQAGVTGNHFTDPRYRNLWGFLLTLRSEGKSCDEATVYAEASNRGALPSIGGTEGLLEATSFNGWSAAAGLAPLRDVLLNVHAKREAYRLLQRAQEDLKNGTASLEDVSAMAERITEICRGNTVVHEPLAEVASVAIAEAEALIAGTDDKEPGLTTGLPAFDKYATPIRSHELVIVGGRSSHGKSSLALQIAMHNITHGKRVAIFVIETTAKAVLKQLAGQKAMMDLRHINQATREQQQDYMKWLRWLQGCKNLLVFDKEMTMEAIESRGRLIAQSFKPDLTVVDQLNNISGGTGSMYERISAHSKRFIPFTKMMGGACLVLAQLNQSAEKEGRRPERTDFRDSSQVLEDAHRVIVTWRKPSQMLDSMWFEHEVLQLKNRDGPLCTTAVRFHAATTRFVETFDPQAA